MNDSITSIVLPTRPQPDTIVAIFLLRTFGSEQYDGVTTATVTVDPKASDAPGKLLIDVGGGAFDHHQTDYCATELVAQKLGQDNNPAVRQLIAYARRDDVEGKGTISKDPIDRTFGLSNFIACLNKLHTKNPELVVTAVLPLLEAHYHAANEHYVQLPKLIEELKQTGLFRSETVHQPQRNTKIAFVTTDHVGLAGYLRSNLGGNYRIIVQRRASGHVNILTKQNPKIDLSKIIALIRLQEANVQNLEIKDESTLYQEGSHGAIPNWYYDPATNSLLNGGVTPDSIEPTQIDWAALQAIILHSLTA